MHWLFNKGPGAHIYQENTREGPAQILMERKRMLLQNGHSKADEKCGLAWSQKAMGNEKGGVNRFKKASVKGKYVRVGGEKNGSLENTSVRPKGGQTERFGVEMHQTMQPKVKNQTQWCRQRGAIMGGFANLFVEQESVP